MATSTSVAKVNVRQGRDVYRRRTVEFFANHLTLTANHTNGSTGYSVYTPDIDNADSSVIAVRMEFVATDDTGTSPTAQIVLCGGNAASPTTALGDGTETIDTAAVDISGADSAPVDVFLDTDNFDRKNFPKVMAGRLTIGGSSTPGATGILSTQVVREEWDG